MKKVQYKFKTKASAETCLKKRGWYMVSCCWLNDKLPGQVREILKKSSRWEINALRTAKPI